MIKLTCNTINTEEIINWLKKDPQLTKGQMTLEFEKKWTEYINVKHAVMVNSGSSANLAMIYALKITESLKNDKIVIPALCWATTISPVIQFGFQPIIADVQLDNLGIDLKQLEKIFKEQNPACLFLVHPLGFVPDMDKIQELCEKYDVLLIEDSCETVGTTWKLKKSGSFGIMSSFSFFFSHHMTTIEGGMICTNSDELYEILLMIRSHGWTRDLSQERKKYYQKKYKIDDFNEQFTFYIPALNIRSTDLQAKIGLEQLKLLPEFINNRFINYCTYQNYLKNDFWKIMPLLVSADDRISNFAYPVIHPKRAEIIQALQKNKIECRPLICGNISLQPAFKDCQKYPTPNSNKIHKYGFYLPNHTDLTQKQIKKICNIINEVIS